MGVPAVQELKRIAGIIRQHQADTCHSLWEIAARLKEARALFPEKRPVVGNKSWSAWTQAEVGLTGDTATRMIRTYEKFYPATSRDKVPFNVLVELASPNTPKALIAEVLEEAEADKPPTVKEVRLRKKGTLPSPREARRMARDSGNFVTASDGNIYSGATEQEGVAARTRRRQTYGVLDAITTLAEVGITPDQWIAEAEDHQIQQFRLAVLDDAIGWLDTLKPAITEKLGVIENDEQAA